MTAKVTALYVYDVEARDDATSPAAGGGGETECWEKVSGSGERR